MPFPNYNNKYNSKSFFTPHDSRKNLEKTGRTIPEFPENIILCYTSYVMEYVTAEYPGTIKDGIMNGSLYHLDGGESNVGIIGKFGFGAPIAVMFAEHLIAMGVKRIISIGTAGTLQKDIDIGSIVVCDKAIRDEGTSYHYIKPSRYAYASPEITGEIKTALDRLGHDYSTGTSWTTDAPYRETVDEVRHHRQEGVATVEMEASALFSLASYRDIQMGAIFTISDSLAEQEWLPEFHSDKTRTGLELICRAAIETLSG